MKKLFLFIMGALFTIDSVAQKQGVFDSIQQVLTSVKNDSDKINILNAISVELFSKYDLKGSIQYANQALSLAKNKSFTKGIATASTNIGKAYIEQHNYFEAIKQLNIASNLFMKINDKSGLAECYYSLGIAYYYLDDNPKALENLFASLKLQQETGNSLKTGKVYIYIGLTYQYQAWYSNDSSYYSNSLKNLDNALQIFKKLNDNDGQARCYDAMASVYLMKGDDDMAMKKVSTALKLLNGSKDRNAFANCYATIGAINERKGLAVLKGKNRSEAFKFFADAKQNFLAAYQIILHESPNKNFLSETLVNLGNINFNMQNYAESKFYLEKGLKMSKEFGFKDIIRDSYSLYVKLDSAQGNYRNAFVHYKLYVLYKDSLSNEENTKKVVQTQLTHEYALKQATAKAIQEKKDAVSQKELQEQKLVRNSFIVGSILLLLLIVVLINRNKLKRNIEMEKMRSRLSRDLHDDIGSTLSSINILSRTAQSNLKQSHDEKTKASLVKINERSQRLLDNMSDIIWNINPGNDTIEEVMSRMREYATTVLEAKNIDYTFDFPKEKIDCTLTMEVKNNMYLIFKEAVNNLSKYSGATTANFSLTFDEKSIHLKIEDNGNGFEIITNESGAFSSPLGRSGGAGLRNMQHRAEEIKGSIKINSILEKGTVIELTMPRYC